MRIMVDTNILLSAILFPESNLSSRLVAVVSQHRLVLPTQIIEESQAVIKRKFPDMQAAYSHFIAQLDFEEFRTPDSLNLDDFPKIRDPKDAPILVSAILSDVAFFITGDKDFHALDLEHPIITNLAEFCAMHLDS